jgi:hypothetical protein
MSNSLIKISQVLADKSANTQLTSNIKMNSEVIKSLNYEVMYKMLEGEVEKLIISNEGNPTIDEFKKNIITKFTYLLSKLTS